jgi:DNA-binding GntR family transcriptional regulator
MSILAKTTTAGSKSGPTRTSEIQHAIKRQILDCQLKPGEKLRFDELRERFGIGISPLREALTRLAAEGLVVSEERRGYHVAPVSREDLQELAMLRAEFDSIGIRESIKYGDAAWEGRIIAALHELRARSKIGSDGTIDWEWDEIHARFHDELVSECRSPRLLAYRRILVDQATRYRRMSVQYLKSPRDPNVEHSEIADAVVNRRTEDACFLVRRHYQRTVETIIAGNEV